VRTDQSTYCAPTRARLSQNPAFRRNATLRGGLRAERGQLDPAVADLKAAVDAAPDNAGFRVGLARILVTANRLDEADAELTRALERQAGNPDARAARGTLLVARGQLAAAVAEFERALAVRPAADDVRLDLADALARTPDTFGFERAAEAFLKLAPSGIIVSC
jgi:Flp pilus assembly protein TadD